jgi:hypothetical protein
MYTNNQQKALLIVPIITGTISLLSSSILVYGITISDRKRRLILTYHRLILGMSVMDIISSFNMAYLGGWTIPPPSSTIVMENSNSTTTATSASNQEEESGWGIGYGTITSCNINGFLGQIGMSGAFYSTCIALYFLITLRSLKRRKENVTVIKNLEILMHLVSICCPITFASFGISQDLFNPLTGQYGWCSYSDYPRHCSQPESAIECIRGANYRTFSMITSSIWTILYLMDLIAMGYLLFMVYRQEHKVRRLSFQGNDHSRVLTKETATQAMLYVGSYIMTTAFMLIPPLVYREPNSDNEQFYFIFVLLSRIFYPLQGFWTIIIYGRIRYKAIRSKLKLKHQIVVFWLALTSPDDYSTLTSNTNYNDSNSQLNSSKNNFSHTKHQNRLNSSEDMCSVENPPQLLSPIASITETSENTTIDHRQNQHIQNNKNICSCHVDNVEKQESMETDSNDDRNLFVMKTEDDSSLKSQRGSRKDSMDLDSSTKPEQLAHEIDAIVIETH